MKRAKAVIDADEERHQAAILRATRRASTSDSSSAPTEMTIEISVSRMAPASLARRATLQGVGRTRRARLPLLTSARARDVVASLVVCSRPSCPVDDHSHAHAALSATGHAVPHQAERSRRRSPAVAAR